MSGQGGRRRSIRLRGYDYSQTGLYFLTLCTYERRCLFGDVVDGAMHLNPLGDIVAQEWMRTADIRREMRLDAFVVMPNHLHGLVWIIDPPANQAPGHISTDPVGAHGVRPAYGVRPMYGRAPLHRPPRSLGSFVAGFKSATTRRINAVRGLGGHPVWQRNYWDHIVRSDHDTVQILEYIQHNPARWTEDRLHPAVGAHGRAPLREIDL